MSEKEKPKRSPRMGFLRSCLVFSLCPVLILTALGCAFVYWANGGFVKPSLDPQYIPTAEYLLENPIEITEREIRYPVIELPERQTPGQICFTVESEYSVDFDSLHWVEIIVNEQSLKPNFAVREIFHSLPGFANLCLHGFLLRGLHIIEFRLRENPADEPYYTYRWAIEIP